MLTLDTALHIPAHVSFSVVGKDVFLLNAHTNKYYRLEEVGTRLWELLSEGKSLKDAHQIILSEYDIDSSQLELDIMELMNRLMENGLVEIA